MALGSRIDPIRYAVVIEKGERNYSAYAPDLPGCVSVGDTVEEVKAEIREAIKLSSRRRGENQSCKEAAARAVDLVAKLCFRAARNTKVAARPRSPSAAG
jgi:hypothetical protein